MNIDNTKKEANNNGVSDYQLERAIDLIKSIDLYENIKERVKNTF